MSVRHEDKWLGRTLLSPTTWLIVGAGIYLHCWLNYTRWQNAGVGEGLATVDEVTPTSQVFYESAIGSVLAVALVLVLCLIKGEKFESTYEGENGAYKMGFAFKVMAFAVVVGFIFLAAVNIIDPINKSRTESMIATRRAERVERMQREHQAAMKAQYEMRAQGRAGIRRLDVDTSSDYRPQRTARPAPQRSANSYEAQMAAIRQRLSTGNNLR
jgi:hypothetical protein